MNKKIFITGADGFIGSHVVEKLIKLNYEVNAFCYYNSFSSRGWLDSIDFNKSKKINFFLGDIRDKRSVEQAMRGCDSLIHLASLISIPYSFNSYESFFDVNVKGALNIFDIAKELKIKKITHISTSETYGTAQYVPIDEKHPLVAQSPYAASKIAADQLALSFYHSFDLPITIIRPFNTYGPRQSLRAIIPVIILQLLRKKKNISLGNINTTRDFSYIDDTVDGILKSHFHLQSTGDIFNLGSSYDISIKELAEMCMNLIGFKSEIIIDKPRIRPNKSEVLRLISNNKKAKKSFNWVPKYNNRKGLEIGLKKFINWLKIEENLNFYKNYNEYNY